MLMLYDISIVTSRWCTVGLGMPDTVTRGVPVFGLKRKLEAARLDCLLLTASLQLL